MGDTKFKVHKFWMDTVASWDSASNVYCSTIFTQLSHFLNVSLRTYLIRRPRLMLLQFKDKHMMTII